MFKSTVLVFICLLLFSILGARVYQLQYLEYNKYKVLAKNNATKSSIEKAPRGTIYDREGKIIASSKQSLRVVAYPNEIFKKLGEDEGKLKKLVSRLAKLLETQNIKNTPRYKKEKDKVAQEEKLAELFGNMKHYSPVAVTIATNISIESAIRIFENQEYLPGINVEKQPIRYYPYGEVTAHVVGYVGEVNDRELAKNPEKDKKLILGDIIGKFGLEKRYDQQLRGVNGQRRIFVDRHGKTRNFADDQPKQLIEQALKGEDLHLTLDMDLQETAFKALGSVNGAVVVVDPRNGEVLAMVSKPSFDPNDFTRILPYRIYEQIMHKKAFINRAINSYTPGSIWKPITSLAALEHNVINPNTKLKVSGATYIGGFRFGDWTSIVDYIGMRTAIAWSRDTYFYQIAMKMKPEWLANTGRALGAGERTNIELDNESSGIVPDPQWKKKSLGKTWYPGNTLHYSIGQSYLLVSPVQAARYTSAMATNGRVPQLHLVRDSEKEKPSRIVKLKDYSFKVVREGMIECVDSGTGTYTKLKGSGLLGDISVAGKSGSAEVAGYAHSTHAWFISYAPTNDPEIVIACFGEGAGHGGSVCAPVAKEIYKTYFYKKRNIIIKSPAPKAIVELEQMDADNLEINERQNDNNINSEANRSSTNQSVVSPNNSNDILIQEPASFSENIRSRVIDERQRPAGDFVRVVN